VRGSAQKIENGNFGHNAIRRVVLHGAWQLFCAKPFGTEVEPEFAAAVDNGTVDFDAGALEYSQSGGNVFNLLQRRGQDHGVFGGFGHAGGDVRAADERSVSDEGDAANGHARRFDIVDGLKKRLGREFDGALELRREKFFRGAAQVVDYVASN